MSFTAGRRYNGENRRRPIRTRRLGHGLQAGTGADPGRRRGPREEVLPRERGLRPDRRHPDRRRAAGGPGRPAGFGVRDRVRHRDHLGRAGLGAGPAPGRVRHRRGAGRDGRARRGDRPGAPPGVGEWVDGPHPERENYQSFADFTDPDGNIWLLQEVDHARADDGSFGPGERRPDGERGDRG